MQYFNVMLTLTAGIFNVVWFLRTYAKIYGDIQNILFLFDKKLNVLSHHIQELYTFEIAKFLAYPVVNDGDPLPNSDGQ